jgi:hypothetical protein
MSGEFWSARAGVLRLRCTREHRICLAWRPPSIKRRRADPDGFQRPESARGRLAIGRFSVSLRGGCSAVNGQSFCPLQASDLPVPGPVGVPELLLSDERREQWSGDPPASAAASEAGVRSPR